MSLTGVPLIIVAVLATAAAGAGTVLLWSRYGRWRMLSRTAGILLTETLVAATVGLVSNRVEMFYPSWAALEGRTGTTVVAAPQPAGRLDGLVRGAAAAVLPWHPAGAAPWRLAGVPRVVLPAGYRNRPSITYPAVVSLVDTGVEAAAAVRAARGVAAVGHTTPALAAPLRLPQAHGPVLAGADGRVRRR